MDDYSIEGLKDKFAEHAKFYDEHNLDFNRRHSLDTFNVSRAFEKICEAIIELRRK